MSEESALLQQSHMTAAGIYLAQAYALLDKAATSLHMLAFLTEGEMREAYTSRYDASRRSMRELEGAY